MPHKKSKPVILITGAAGNIGTALAKALCANYTLIGLDIHKTNACDESLIFDITSEQSITSALEHIKEGYGSKIKAVIHLAAYFDFTGNPSPLYKKINEDGTKKFLEKLQDFHIERFVYSSTMLVHKPNVPGHRITEDTPVKPGWPYPQSKARTEKVIKRYHGNIPVTILRLAGLYDEHSAVPTLSHQIARIYEKDIKSHLYAGHQSAGQSFIHRDDLISAFKAVIEHVHALPEYHAVLIGEPDTESYESLQNRIGELIHGAKEWTTISVPKMIAKSGSWLEQQAEEIIPDALDEGEKPFVRPFMVDLASDHYELDISYAKEILNWHPVHNIYETLPALIKNLKKDPADWYTKNGVAPPDWLESADDNNQNPEDVRTAYIKNFRLTHYRFLWAHFANLFLAIWLITSPFTLSYEAEIMIWSDVISGVLLFIFGFVSLSWRHSWARLVCGTIGVYLLGAPLFFWAPSAAAYLNDTLTGLLVTGFAVLSRPWPFMSPIAAVNETSVPQGWNFSPSSWFQRFPVILMAVIGFFISRYLCAYQLGHIDSVWEPFFTGAANNDKNGTEEIITSSVSKAWPIPDAGLGALTYALEIITGLIGSASRWRTMPWLVMLFGFMIVPLGIVSITFIIIQPIILGTWCTLCLIAAAAMVVQIPYSFDELVASGEFLWRKYKAGRPWLKIFFTGDMEDGEPNISHDNFEQTPYTIIKDIVNGGVSFPWNLLVCIGIGIWLMFTRLTLDASGNMAHADHLIGALVVTTAVTALAETARPVRFLLMPLGFGLFITSSLYGASVLAIASGILCSLALMTLSIRRGSIISRYGAWENIIK